VGAVFYLANTSMPTTTAIPRDHPRGYMFGTNVGTLDGACDAAAVGRHDVTEESPSWTWSAGNAVSTVADLTVWARALATGALLSPATQAERVKCVDTAPGSPARYGLHIGNFAGISGHDGALPGFQTFMGYAPARAVTIIVTANVFVDATCGSPADTMVKSIVKEVGLLGP
jgi:D-alanyl-D-alanine carboxypeptidase